MSAQQRVRQQAQVFNWSANLKQGLELSRGFVYRELHCRLQGQLTVTSGDNTQALTNPGDEWAAVHQLILKANGNDEIKRISGADLRWLDYFNMGTFPAKALAHIGAGGGNPTFDSTLIVPLWIPKTVSPMDTALDSRQLARLDLEVDWGTYTDINADATGFTVAPNMTVQSMEVFNVAGPFARWNTFPMVNSVPGANTKFQIRIPVGPVYRGFMIKQNLQGTIANFKLLSGTTIFADIPASILQTSWGQNRTGVNVAQVYTPNNQWLASSQVPDSPLNYYYYDHVASGKNTESIDTLGFDEFIVELNCTQADTITLYPIQIIPVRGASGTTTAASSASGMVMRKGARRVPLGGTRS